MRFKLRGRFKPPRVMRKFQFGSLARQVAGFIPGGNTALSLYDMAGDPKQLKRATRAAKKGQHTKAARHLAKSKPGKKGPGFGARLLRNAGRAAGSMGQPLQDAFSGNIGGMFHDAFQNPAAAIGAGRMRGFGHHRRMNVGNVRALRRSVRRVEGFAKLARKTLHLTRTVKLRHRGRKR